MRIRSKALGAAAAAGALVVAGCSTPGASTGSAAAGDSGAGGTLVMSTPTAPDSLDATIANTFAARLVFSSMCEGLFTVDSNLKVVPQLAAETPKISADGLTMDIKLKQGVKFSDGTPFDAAAVVTTLERNLTKKGSARVQELSAVASVKAVDPTSVQLKLKRPSAPLAAQLSDRAGLIMSPTALQKEGDDFGKNPSCVGPFKFKSMVAGNEIALVKDPNYYDADKVKLAGVTYKFITDSSVATANLQSGDINAAEHIVPSDAEKLKSAGLEALTSKTIAYQGISINVSPSIGTPLSKSADLRKAFEMSIDREALNKSVWGGSKVTDCNPLPVQSEFYTKVECTPFDVEGAKKLVAASGVPTPVPVELMASSSAVALREAQVVQSMAGAVGFKVNIKQLDLVSALQIARAGKADAFIVGWSGRVDPDGNTNDLLTTGGSNNFSELADPQVDSLIQKAGSTNDNAQRKTLYAEALKKVADIRSNIYLYHDTWFLGTAKNVTGIDYRTNGIPYLKTASVG
ncbi:ABC transporter substrate-binding protein [Kribbella sp. NPDC051770]|uniref:ABC transporter substrate-binding protein n=1 Tax=Kribbella sp. NPDC051770 TaxID=3155413 RepID=UPI00344868F6